MTTFAIQAGALRTNPNSGPDGVGVQADVAYTLEARAEVQAVCVVNDTRAEESKGGQANPANDNSIGGEPLRFLSVCSGIEAASTAWSPLGWKAVAFSEIEKFPSAVLAHHYPDVPNLGDFTKIDTTTLGRVDILCGGTPCQAFSVAGLRNSLADARGNLSLEFVRLAHELAGISEAPHGHVRGPAGNGLRNVVWENVPGVLNTKDNAFGCFLGGLVGADAPLLPPRGRKWPSSGMVDGPKGRAAWRVLDAQYFGLAQRRRRVILVADFGNGADPAAVLFELAGMRGNTPPSREKGKDVTPTISARTKGGGGLGTDFDLDGGLVEAAPPIAYGGNRTSGPLDVATAVNAHGGPHGRLDFESETFVTQTVAAYRTAGDGAVYEEGRVTAPLTTGTDPNANVIAFSSKDYGGDATEELSPTLRASGHTDSHPNAGAPPAVALSVALRGREGGATAELGGEQAGTLRASGGGGDKPHVLTSAVRRLTPKECERLQGFPDDYTLIPWRGKPADQCPDGPRYKALGNSWAVPKFVWIGRRIAALMPKQAANDNTQQRAAA